MSGVKEIPELVKEAVDLSKDYLRQETLEPAKRLGRLAGFSLGAALLFAAAVLLLAIAGTRWLVDALPEEGTWSGVGYLIAAGVLLIVAGLIVFLGSRSGRDRA